MTKPHIEGQVIEINDGPYFNVTLHAVPQVGELIHLHSLVDEAADYPPDKHYEVVQVLHRLYDVPEGMTPGSRRRFVAGTHYLQIFVKRSTSLEPEQPLTISTSCHGKLTKARSRAERSILSIGMNITST
jgi:hypothetical protein